MGVLQVYLPTEPYLCKKKCKDSFLALVRKFLSREFITTELARKFSKRARKYMLAYQALDSDEIKEQTTTETTGISKQMIEKMIKIVSSHRAALDFDRRYLDRIITKEGFSLVDYLKSESKGLSKNYKRKWQTKNNF